MPARERMKKAATKKRGRPRKGAETAEVGEGGQEPLSNFRREEGAGDDEVSEDTIVERKGSKATQNRLPGQERKTSKKVEKKALALYATQSERLALQQREKEERADLHATMKAEEIDRQVLPGGLVAELKQSEEKALVHKADDAEASEV